MNTHWSPWAGGGPEFAARRRPTRKGGADMGARHDLQPGAPLTPEIQLVHDTYQPRRIDPEDWERQRSKVQAWFR